MNQLLKVKVRICQVSDYADCMTIHLSLNDTETTLRYTSMNPISYVWESLMFHRRIAKDIEDWANDTLGWEISDIKVVESMDAKLLWAAPVLRLLKELRYVDVVARIAAGNLYTSSSKVSLPEWLNLLHYGASFVTIDAWYNLLLEYITANYNEDYVKAFQAHKPMFQEG